MIDNTRRDALVRHLCARLSDDNASLDEIRVIDWLWTRLEKGRDAYGKLELAGDTRNWGHELLEEMLDMLVYRSIRSIVARDKNPAFEFDVSEFEG